MKRNKTLSRKGLDTLLDAMIAGTGGPEQAPVGLDYHKVFGLVTELGEEHSLKAIEIMIQELGEAFKGVAFDAPTKLLTGTERKEGSLHMIHLSAVQARTGPLITQPDGSVQRQYVPTGRYCLYSKKSYTQYVSAVLTRLVIGLVLGTAKVKPSGSNLYVQFELSRELQAEVHPTKDQGAMKAWMTLHGNSSAKREEVLQGLIRLYRGDTEADSLHPLGYHVKKAAGIKAEVGLLNGGMAAVRDTLSAMLELAEGPCAGLVKAFKEKDLDGMQAQATELGLVPLALVYTSPWSQGPSPLQLFARACMGSKE